MIFEFNYRFSGNANLNLNLHRWEANTPPAKAGGFGLRLKAVTIGHSDD
jgi:hypothetical protein